MNKLACLVLMIGLSGCARYWVREDMQPDRSYKIEVDGNGPATIRGAKAMAHNRASLLCPNGYQTNAEIPVPDIKPSYTLVVMCDAGGGPREGSK